MQALTCTLGLPLGLGLGLTLTLPRTRSVPNPMFKRSRDTLSMKLSIPLRAVREM